MSWFNLNIEAFSYALLSILYEGIPFLLLGALISGFVDVFVSSERITRLLPRNPVASILLAGTMGMAFPICECGSVVIVRRFVRKGLPLASAVAYMLAAPIVNPLIAISTFKAYQAGSIGGVTVSPETMTIMRLAMGFFIAVAVALVIHRLPQRRILQPDLLGAPPERQRTGLRIAGSGDSSIPDFAALVAKASPLGKAALAIRSAVADFLDVAFYFVIGASLAALFVGFRESAIEPIATAPFLSITALMGLASLLCLCSSTDAFVAANSFAIFSPEANLAFLVFGPVFDLKLFWLYGIIFKRRFVLAMGAFMFLLIALISWRIHASEALGQRLPSIPEKAAQPAETPVAP